MNEKLPALKGLAKKWMRPKLLAGIAVGVIVALIIALIAVGNNAATARRQYADVRDATGQALYARLNMMIQTFNMATVPNADVQYNVLPQMKTLFHGAVALNELLKEEYSVKYQVLDDADITAIDSAFTAYETAFRDGSSTDLAASNMQACMARAREVLDARYAGGVLRPRR